VSVRLLVCGGRRYRDRERVFQVLDGYARCFDIEVVIHGAMSGADMLAQDWARTHGYPDLPFPADWDDLTTPPVVVKHRKDGRPYNAAAGPARNGRMLAEGKPTHVIAFPGNAGTANMISQAIAAGVLVVEVEG